MFFFSCSSSSPLSTLRNNTFNYKFISNFLYCSRFFILTKDINTAHTSTETEQNLLHGTFSHQDFVNLFD